MTSAERADGIEDVIHFVKRHAVHVAVQRFEIGFDLIVVQPVNFAVSLVEKRQDRFAVAGS